MKLRDRQTRATTDDTPRRKHPALEKDGERQDRNGDPAGISWVDDLAYSSLLNRYA
jgi:hypothetical protein